MSGTLVQRLRLWWQDHGDGSGMSMSEARTEDLCNEAAEQIERLRRALVIAAMPLEAMVMAGSTGMHAPEVEHAIHEAVSEIRSTIAETG